VKDVERDEYLRRTFGRDAARAEDYDLVVNTGELELERAADVVVAALRGKFGELSRLLPACGRAIGAEDGVGAGRALQPGSLMEAER
jgi:hypothetical protein